MLHIISDFTAKSLLTLPCLRIRILQIRGIQLGEWGWEEYESSLNIICGAPEKVTKSFELTEKMRKLIATSWFIYIRLESSRCFQEPDVPFTNKAAYPMQKKAGNAEVHI